MLKIDVEGAECAVLKGAQNFLEKFNPVIFLEVHTDKSFGGVTFNDIWKIVSQYDVDYDPRIIEKQEKIEYHILIPNPEHLQII